MRNLCHLCSAEKFIRRPYLWKKFASTYSCTTPLFYVNGPPHIGHLYTALIADASCQWQKMRNPSVETFLITGTDEHGQKVQETASRFNRSPQSLADEISAKFRNCFSMFGINFTSYVRTTEQKHVAAVEHLWNTLVKKDVIYKGLYTSWYSVRDEAFYGDFQVHDIQGEDGTVTKVSRSTNAPVVLHSEENYMFRLQEYIPRVREWLTSEEVLFPPKFLPVVLDVLEKQTTDLSVSRCSSRLQWGIPVPGDPSQTIYVWLDALTGYLSACGYPHNLDLWPPDCQLIAKDILKFHTFYWPAFLLAADLPLPRRIFCHSHWTSDGVKMSKSLNNFINPVQEAEKYTAEGVRYALLRQGDPCEDADFTSQTIRNLLRHELADVIGNLMNRCTTLQINPDQVYPALNLELLSELDRNVLKMETEAAIANLEVIGDEVAKCYDDMLFQKGVDLAMGCARLANTYYDHVAPWSLKDPHGRDAPVRDTINHVTYELLRLSALLLQPVLPQLMDRILTRIGVDANERTFEFCRPILKCPRSDLIGRQLGQHSGILFRWQEFFPDDDWRKQLKPKIKINKHVKAASTSTEAGA